MLENKIIQLVQGMICTSYNISSNIRSILYFQIKERMLMYTRIFSYSTLLFFILSPYFVYSQTLSNTIWLTENKKAKVKLTIKPDQILEGHIVWLKKEAENNIILLDEKNKDISKRTRPLMGSMILWGFKKNKKIWENGMIYAADKGKTYHGTLKWIDAETLRVKGCVSFICKSQIWKRAQ